MRYDLAVELGAERHLRQAAAVPVVLATDDPGLMLSDLRQQFTLAARNLGYSFLPSADRHRLLRRLEDDFALFEATPW